MSYFELLGLKDNQFCEDCNQGSLDERQARGKGGGGVTSILKVYMYTDVRLKWGILSGLQVYEWVLFSLQVYQWVSYSLKKYMNR